MRRAGVRLVGGSRQVASATWLRASGVGGTLVPRPQPDTAQGLRRAPKPHAPNSSPASKRATTTLARYVGGGYAFGKADSTSRAGGSAPSAAYGRYHYDGALPVDGVYVPTDVRRPGSISPPRWSATNSVPGGRLIVKLFAGIEAEDQHHRRRTIRTIQVQGSALGLRLQAESWLDLSERMLSLRRRLLRHRVPGILGAGAAGLSAARATLVGAGRRRARQRGI